MTDSASTSAHPRTDDATQPHRAPADDATTVTFEVVRSKTGCNKNMNRLFPFHLTEVDHVLGLTLPGEPPLHAGPPFAAFAPRRSRIETTLSMPRAQAERLRGFFEEFFTRGPKPARTWNQHLFVRRVAGAGPLPFDADPTLPPRCTDLVDPNDPLEPGTPYGVRHTDREPISRTLVAADTDMTLSVIGWNKYLIIASGRRLYHHWFGTSMHRLDLAGIDRPADYPQP